VDRGVADVRLGDGTRQIFPIVTSGAEGVVVISTALGNVRLAPARGVPLEGAGGVGAGAKQIKSSMPGKVLKILCKPGETIEPGQPLLIIEAMKMENEIRAKHGGVVAEIPVQTGQKVETGEVLVKFEAGA
jgi:biotin carboxyl carrier protein